MPIGAKLREMLPRFSAEPKVGSSHRHGEHQRQERHRHPEGLGAEHLLPQRLLAHADHIVKDGMVDEGGLGRNG